MGLVRCDCWKGTIQTALFVHGVFVFLSARLLSSGWERLELVGKSFLISFVHASVCSSLLVSKQCKAAIFRKRLVTFASKYECSFWWDCLLRLLEFCGLAKRTGFFVSTSILGCQDVCNLNYVLTQDEVPLMNMNHFSGGIVHSDCWVRTFQTCYSCRVPFRSWVRMQFLVGSVHCASKGTLLFVSEWTTSCF